MGTTKHILLSLIGGDFLKKVGIISLCDNNNFGNRLQSYALKHYIEKLGFEVHPIWLENNVQGSRVKRLAAIIKNRIKKIKYHKRIRLFKKFTDIYLKPDYSIFLDNRIERLKDKYDYFAIGSDQVWNYNYTKNFKIFFGLSFDKVKCFSYAASFGVSSLRDDLKGNYKEGLEHLNYISVREIKGKEIVAELCNDLDVEVLVDPTLLLDKYEWGKIEKKPEFEIPSSYILTYFLGDLSEERKKEIYDTARKNNMQVISLMDKTGKYYNIGPSEFLFLIHQSSLVCTDSFHACVFSLLYDKSFLVFDREYKGANINSRIDNLLGSLKLKNRRFSGKIDVNNLEHNYEESYKLLEFEKEKSKLFLKRALNINDDV